MTRPTDNALLNVRRRRHTDVTTIGLTPEPWETRASTEPLVPFSSTIPSITRWDRRRRVCPKRSKRTGKENKMSSPLLCNGIARRLSLGSRRRAGGHAENRKRPCVRRFAIRRYYNDGGGGAFGRRRTSSVIATDGAFSPVRRA